MTDYEKICNFGNLYRAHTIARRSKRDTSEVIDFELKLSSNLTEISESLKNHTYKMSGYYSFVIHDPKDRKIHALHYRDPQKELKEYVIKDLHNIIEQEGFWNE